MAIQMQHSHRLFLQSFMSKGILNSQEVRTLYNSATTRFGGWSPKWDTLSIMLINSLRPSEAIWRHRCGSTLAQVMACCLMAPSHYLNQCWLVISEVQWGNDINIRAISQEMPQPSVTKICLKITCLKFHSNFPGANELIPVLVLCVCFFFITFQFHVNQSIIQGSNYSTAQRFRAIGKSIWAKISSISYLYRELKFWKLGKWKFLDTCMWSSCPWYAWCHGANVICHQRSWHLLLIHVMVCLVINAKLITNRETVIF